MWLLEATLKLSKYSTLGFALATALKGFFFCKTGEKFKLSPSSTFQKKYSYFLNWNIDEK